MKGYLLSFLLFGALLVGCGKSNSGTGNVDFYSAPATPTRALFSAFSMDQGRFWAADTRVALQQLAICVKRVRLDGDDDQAVKKAGETGDSGEQDPDDITFKPGLVKLISGGAAISSTDFKWGTASIPVGFKLKRIRMKIKKDATLCADSTFDPNGDSSIYGIRTGNQIFSTNSDVEFKFRFNPSIDIADGSAVRLTLDTFVTAIKNAAQVSDITGNSLKSLIEGGEGSCDKKN